MRVLCITDIHGFRDKFEQILRREPEPDLLLLGGDFTNFGSAQEAEGLLDLALLYCPKVFAVAGNCDNAEIDAMLLRRGVSLHTSGQEFNGFGFFGLSSMPPWRGDMYEFPETKLNDFLAQGYAHVQKSKRFIMLCHPPPHDTRIDFNNSKKHVGSTSVRAWMEKTKPALLVCGHIHEARGLDEWQATKIVNCGPSKQGYYAVAEVGEQVKVELKHID